MEEDFIAVDSLAFDLCQYVTPAPALTEAL